MTTPRFLATLASCLVFVGCQSATQSGSAPEGTSKERSVSVASVVFSGDLPPKERTVEFTYTTTVAEVPAGARELQVWIPAPQHQPPLQEVISARISEAGGGTVTEHASPDRSNVWWHVRIPDPKPPVRIVATMTVRRREQMNNYFRGAGTTELSADERARFSQELGANEMVPITGRFEGLASSTVQSEKNIVNAARRVYDYVLEHMRYSKDGQGWGRGDSVWACDSGFGNCTDFHSLFMSIARNRGIPARFHMGFPLPEARGAGVVGGYHCWAEFYVPAHGWVPVDISEADKHPELAQYYFGALTEDRISFTTGRDLSLTPAPAGGRRNFFIYPLAEVDGKEVKADKAFAYKDA